MCWHDIYILDIYRHTAMRECRCRTYSVGIYTYRHRPIPIGIPIKKYVTVSTRAPRHYIGMPLYQYTGRCTDILNGSVCVSVVGHSKDL